MIRIFEVQPEVYRTPGGQVVQREAAEGGAWVLRDEKGRYIDQDQFRFSLFERNNFRPEHLNESESATSIAIHGCRAHGNHQCRTC